MKFSAKKSVKPLAPTPTPAPPAPAPSGAGPTFYADTDPFNTPIASDAATDVSSDAWVALLQRNASNANLSITTDWGYPIYRASESDPEHTIAGLTYHTGTRFTFQLPASAAANTGSDAHLVVISPDGKTETDFWGFSRSGSAVQARTVWQNDCSRDTGSSICPTVGGVAGSTNASHLGLLAGTVLACEMAAGIIPHALGFSIPQTASSFRAPATASDGKTPGGIPQGARIQLDPSYDITELASWIQPIARALQVYGAILCDTGGSLGFFAESPTTGNYPPGVGTSLSSIPWSSCRVLAA